IGCRSSARIGIGIWGEALERTVALLGDRGCSVELSGFDDPSDLSSELSRNRLDGGVRGMLSSSEMIESVKSDFSIDIVMRTALLASSEDKTFMLAPVGIDEGRTKSERLDLVRTTIAYFRSAGWHPTIGVLSGGRPEDALRGEKISRSLQDGRDIADELTDEGFEAKHYHILVEKAVKESDFVVAPDGVAGNLMFRTLHFLGSGRAFGAPVVNLPAVLVDTSRAKTDFVESVILAAGLAEVGCGAERDA
ncbi:MAG: hypothetical protein JSV94_06705, partial [Methanobacteriota archaeon]